MAHDNLHCAVKDRAATPTIDRPERKNAMTFAMNAEYGRLIREATRDDAVHVLVLTGVAGSFCAGTDLSDLDERAPKPGVATDQSAHPGWAGGRWHRGH